MKLARICIKCSNCVEYAIYDGSEYKIISDPFSHEPSKNNGEKFKDEDVELLCPVEPSKVVCVGLNYSEHAAELNFDLPKNPIIFIKPSTSVIGDGENIIYPNNCTRVDYEAELAVVISKKCKDIEPEDAQDYILGYTCLNDITAREIQSQDGQWTRSKSFDTFCAIGPMIETEGEYSSASIRSILNGHVMQDSNTSFFIHGINSLVSFVSKSMTLLPGDVIATGTPSGIGPMQRGDIIEIEISGVGKLSNKVI